MHDLILSKMREGELAHDGRQSAEGEAWLEQRIFEEYLKVREKRNLYA